ncbi:hypothetical protein [Helicobacter turcicus]|uniref:Lipoprotein n=1 Tax=Helicobacter turcicus TaxID=2867412 RepID=A0ABS7JLG1_9HELI|nr:hypothetical protein [Helicobacter turcicus]MBX7490228.1 hypothetical protein [Helicobacter turcicus]MBX7545193.1 hypothetical protein [Helicobacter turcicus]
MRFLILCCVLVFVGCSDNMESKKDSNVESNKTSLESKNLDEKEVLEALETPLQKELKRSLKGHLDSLSEELHSKTLENLQFENTGAKQHFRQFESFGQSNFEVNVNSPSLHLQKAYILQQTQIEKLRQKNDEIGK